MRRLLWISLLAALALGSGCATSAYSGYRVGVGVAVPVGGWGRVGVGTMSGSWYGSPWY
jgi:hypothetical protein